MRFKLTPGGRKRQPLLFAVFQPRRRLAYSYGYVSIGAMSVATTIPGVFNATEAAEYLGIEPSAVRRYCIDGRLKGDKLGSNWILRQTELDRFKSIPRLVGNPNFRRKRQRNKK